MEKNKFVPVWDHDINKSIQDLIAEGTNLKNEIFRRVLKKDALNVKTIKLYESNVNNFLRFWDCHAEGLESAMDEVTNIPENADIKTIEYNIIKRYVYADYDYASVLKFVDGVITGIEEGEFKKPEDIERFKDSTIEMAFDIDVTTIAGLIDSIIGPMAREDRNNETNSLEVKMFSNVRNYQNLFPSKHHTELFNSIVKVIEYMVGPDNILLKDYQETEYDKVKLFVSLINNMVEYITYSLASYAARIFMLSTYARPFIEWHNGSREPGVVEEGYTDELRKIKAEKDKASQKFIDSLENTAKVAFDAADEIEKKWKDNKNSSLEESVKLGGFSTADINENPGGAVSSVFQNTDEFIIKDPKRSKEFFERFEEFIKLIGADSLFKGPMPKPDGYVGYRTYETTKLYQVVKDNPLYNHLRGSVLSGGTSGLKDSQIAEFHNDLKMFMYNKYQGVQGTSVPRNDLLHAIARTSYGESVANYKELAKDLYVLTMDLSGMIRGLMERTTDNFDSLYQNNRLSVASKKLMGECTKFAIDLYQEVMFACAQRAGFIERKINDLRYGELNKSGSLFSLNIVPGMPSDATPHDYSMLSVPVTMRMPMKDMDLYQLPVFESLEMFDEYLRSTSLFENDWYLNEAEGGIRYSTIVNTIISFLQSLGRKIMDFFTRNLDAQKKWVAAKKDVLLNMKFDPNAQINNWINYSVDLSAAGTAGKDIQHLTTALKGLKDEDFGSEHLMKKLFRAEDQNDYGAMDLAKAQESKKNQVMFSKNNGEPVQPAALKLASNKSVIDGWVTNILSSDNIGNQLNRWNNEILNAFNSVKPKLINPPKKPATTTAQTQVAKESVEDDIFALSLFEESQYDAMIEAQTVKVPKPATAGSTPAAPEKPKNDVHDRINQRQADANAAQATEDKKNQPQNQQGKNKKNAEPEATTGDKEKDAENATGATTAVKYIDNAIKIIWTPVYTGVMEVLMHEYKCLQQAYSVRSK